MEHTGGLTAAARRSPTLATGRSPNITGGLTAAARRSPTLATGRSPNITGGRSPLADAARHRPRARVRYTV